MNSLIHIHDPSGIEVEIHTQEESGYPEAEYQIYQGKILQRSFFTWDSQGRLIQHLLDDGEKRDSEDLTGVTKRRRSTYTSEWVLYEETSQDLTQWHVVESRLPQVAEKDPKRKKKSKGVWTFLQETWDNVGAFWQTQEDLVQSGYEHLDTTFKHVFGEMNLFWWGVYPQETETGVVGHGEISKKVRISGINGMLNSQIDCVDLAKLISDLHGGVNIHYTYWPSEGWTRDLCVCTAMNMGYHNKATEKLAKMWKGLLEEMGTGGKLIHYAHSIGCTTSVAAKDYLSKKEQKRIEIRAFGPAIFVPNKGFGKVTNYVSVRDGVSLLDPMRYVEAISGEAPHVIFVGDVYGPPLIDHFIVNGAYYEKLQELGAEFIEEYGSMAPPS